MSNDTDDDALLARVRAEEQELRFARFDHAAAWTLGSWLVTTGVERQHPIAISIRFGRQRVFHAALAGSSAENDGWLDRKIASVELFGTSSLAVGASFRARGRDFAASSGLDQTRYTDSGGAFPLNVGGLVAGVVAVSGLTQLEDHDLVVEALRAVGPTVGGRS
jgi:uncharacterized protein (UPF0303 family)